MCKEKSVRVFTESGSEYVLTKYEECEHLLRALKKRKSDVEILQYDGIEKDEAAYFIDVKKLENFIKENGFAFHLYKKGEEGNSLICANIYEITYGRIHANAYLLGKDLHRASFTSSPIAKIEGEEQLNQWKELYGEIFRPAVLSTRIYKEIFKK